MPWWHRSNPFWRYGALQLLMLTLAFALGGWAGLGLFLLARLLNSPRVERVYALVRAGGKESVEAKLSRLMETLLSQRQHIAVVVGEYGETKGLVTLEDILEEVVGEFTTHIAEQNSEEIQPQADGSFLVDGSINLRDLNREMQLNFPLDGPKTLNGLILEYLEEIPQSNLGLKLLGYPIEILEVQDNMIKTVRLTPQRQPE